MTRFAKKRTKLFSCWQNLWFAKTLKLESILAILAFSRPINSYFYCDHFLAITESVFASKFKRLFFSNFAGLCLKKIKPLRTHTRLSWVIYLHVYRKSRNGHRMRRFTQRIAINSPCLLWALCSLLYFRGVLFYCCCLSRFSAICNKSTAEQHRTLGESKPLFRPSRLLQIYITWSWSQAKLQFSCALLAMNPLRGKKKFLFSDCWLGSS